jgi:hypothetical protein
MDSAKSGTVARKPSKRRSETVKKWTRPVLDAGYTYLPSVLLTRQHELGLDAVDLNILLQLIVAWWKADNPPYLSKKVLGRRLGLDPGTVRRRINRLVERGFLVKQGRYNQSHQGQTSNRYILKPLVDKLHPFAVEERKARRSKREAAR